MIDLLTFLTSPLGLPVHWVTWITSTINSGSIHDPSSSLVNVFIVSPVFPVLDWLSSLERLDNSVALIALV